MFGRSKKNVIRDNAAKGEAGERRVKSRYEMSGYKMKRTGRGHDFKATRNNWLTGKKETKYVEVKTGGAKLSPLQKRKKRRFGKKYVVERGDSLLSLSFPSKGRPPKKQGSARLLGSSKPSAASLFGSPKSSRKKSGSAGLFGSPKSSRKKSGSAGLFGSPKSSRKKSGSAGLFGSPKGRRSRSPKWTI